MKVLATSKDIKNELIKLQPNRIAVAYIGIDYQDFIQNIKNIDQIIISPTIGSNPQAIGDIVNKIGWEKVSFLDNLHTKIYIGNAGAIITSANLSRNGLDVDESQSLIEIGVFIDEENEIKIINERFDEIARMANDNDIGYPDVESKVNRLELLHKENRRAYRYNIRGIKNEAERVYYDSYVPAKHGEFKIVWYQPEDMDLNFDKIKDAFPGEDINDIQCNIKNILNFAENDDIQENEWILCWKRTGKNTCNKRTRLEWLYVHKKIKKGCKGEYCKSYPDIVLELVNEKRPREPFVIDDAFQYAFRHVIDREEFLEFRDGQSKIWYVKNTLNKFIRLIDAIKAEYRILL